MAAYARRADTAVCPETGRRDGTEREGSASPNVAQQIAQDSAQFAWCPVRQKQKLRSRTTEAIVH
jgi:hypothetical protein